MNWSLEFVTDSPLEAKRIVYETASKNVFSYKIAAQLYTLIDALPESISQIYVKSTGQIPTLDDLTITAEINHHVSLVNIE